MFFGLPKQENTKYSYYSFGLIKDVTISASGLENRVYQKQYDSKGRFVQKEIDPYGHEINSLFDAKWGKPTSITGIDGVVTTMLYDGFGRLISSSSGANYTVSYLYGWDINTTDKSIKFELISHPGKPNKKTFFDILGRVVKLESESYNSTIITQKTTYNHLGKVVSETAPQDVGESLLTTNYTYEPLYTTNKVASVGSAPFGYTNFSYTYNQGVLKSRTVNAANQSEDNFTDVSGKVVQTIDATGNILDYIYYSHGGIKEVKSGNTVLVSHLYDIYGRKSKMTDINAGITDYEFDAFGQLVYQKNANNQIHEFTYDKLGRILTKIMPEGTTTYEYYGTGFGAKSGKLKKITGFAGEVTEYNYDTRGRLSEEKITFQGNVYSTFFAYNIYDDLIKTTYPSGFELNRAYSAKGFLQTLKNNNNALTLYTTNSVNGRNQVRQYTCGNGKQSNITYFHGIPTYYLTSGVQNLSMRWQYSTMNLMSRRDNMKNRIDTFKYDGLNRLSEFKTGTITGITISLGSANVIQYAANGNINSKFDAGIYSYNPNKINAVSTVTNPSNNVTDLLQNIQYNSFFQPQNITEGGPPSSSAHNLTFVYGADEQRIKSELKFGATTIYSRLYFGDYEINTQGGVTRHLHYVSVGDKVIAIVEKNGTTYTNYYTYTDHLGSILTVTNSSGAVVTEQNFDPWGRQRNVTTWAYSNYTPPHFLIRGYTGHEHLYQFGLINMNGRLYDPILGRMLSPDNNIQNGLFFQNYNRYSYVYNNPLKYTDPDGEFIVAGIIGASIGVTINGIVNLANQRDFFHGAGKSAIFGFVSGALAFGVGAEATSVFGSGFSYGKALFQATSHGFIGSASSFLNGGSMGLGFVSGFVASGFSSGAEALRIGPASLIVIGGVTGGVTNSINGGSFWEGAKYGLIASGLNHSMHSGSSTNDDPPIKGDRKVVDGNQGAKILMEYTGCGENGWEVVRIIPGSGAIMVSDSPIEWVLAAWKTPFSMVDDIAFLGFAKLPSGSGLSKILVKGTDDIIDISKFNKGVYKNWRLGIDRSAGTINAHGGSYYKLTNTTSKSYRLTLDNTGKILRK